MPNNMILLETIALTQSASSVTFDNLPTSGYTDLKIVMSTRTSDTTVNDSSAVAIQFNGDTGSNYTRRSLYGDGGAVGSTSATTTSMRVGFTTTNGDTANTFGSGEFYIPNYRSSTQKSVSADAVTEANVAQYIYAAFNAGIWTGTAAITSITVIAPSFSFLAGSTFSLYGIAAFGTTPVLAPKATGGNIVANDGTYWYHAFTSSGNFVPQTGLTADCLVIAGGGGAGYSPNGGGSGGAGAGGLLYSASQSITTTSYAVTVGAGGNSGSSSYGTNGSNSIFNGITATGGGRGGAGGTGGSGGGGGYQETGNAGTPGQGNAGGAGSPSGSPFGAAGGGGAGAATSNLGSSTNGGAGGAGINTYSSWATATGTGASGYYAGGGGGSARGSAGGTGGAGGLGGGGAASASSGGTAGTPNTGGGGGGAADNGTGGAGGSGIVIIRYPIA